MTATAGTSEYVKEYNRRRYRGLPTQGLAEEMRQPGWTPTPGRASKGATTTAILTERRRAAAEVMIVKQFPTSKVMDALSLTYEQVQSVRERMAQ